MKDTPRILEATMHAHDIVQSSSTTKDVIMLLLSVLLIWIDIASFFAGIALLIDAIISDVPFKITKLKL